MAEKTVGFTPVAHNNEDHCQGQKLADFHAHVEREQVRYQPIRGDVVLNDFRGQAKAVEEAEDQRGGLGVGLETEPALIRAHVIQCLVHHRQPDDGVNDVAVYADVEVHAQ